MNERQHIALTEAQIIEPAKPSKPEFTGFLKDVPAEIIERMLIEQEAQGNKRDASVFDINFNFDKSRDGFNWAETDLGLEGWENASNGDYSDFYKLYPKKEDIAEQAEPAKPEPKQLYEVGEIIETNCFDGTFQDIEYIGMKSNLIAMYRDGLITSCDVKYTRKKQKSRIYISGRITGLDYKEAFYKFDQAENDLTAKGYDVVNPMKLMPFNKDWSWFDYLSADIKLMENCTHIYMLSNWRESGGASVEHEISKWKNITIIYQ